VLRAATRAGKRAGGAGNASPPPSRAGAAALHTAAELFTAPPYPPPSPSSSCSCSARRRQIVLSVTQDEFFRAHKDSNYGDLDAAVRKMLDEYAALRGAWRRAARRGG
jgi:hypothetical protein